MAAPPKLEIDDLNESEAKDIVDKICHILWPRDEAQKEWSPDTMDEIVQVLDSYHLSP